MYNPKYGLDADCLEGRYANHFQVGYNAFEFLLEFGQSYLEDKQAQLHTRIVTTPVYAKDLLTILQGAIARYEASVGSIPPSDIPTLERGQTDNEGG